MVKGNPTKHLFIEVDDDILDGCSIASVIEKLNCIDAKATGMGMIRESGSFDVFHDINSSGLWYRFEVEMTPQELQGEQEYIARTAARNRVTDLKLLADLKEKYEV
jgi:hypothetical protein